MNKVVLLTILMMAYGSRVLASCQDELIVNKTEYLRKQFSFFKKFCVDSATNTVLEDVSFSVGDRTLECSEAWNRVQALKADLESERDEQVSCDPQACAECHRTLTTLSTSSSGEVDEGILCTSRQKAERNPETCVRDLLAGLSGYDILVQGKSNCVVEFVKGVWKDLAYSVESLRDIGHWTKDFAAKSWKKLWRYEDVSSDALLATANTKDSMLKQFAKAPGEFVLKLTQQLWGMFEASARENFGCDQWERGVDGSEICARPMSSWSCASCHQMNMAVCGMIGYAGGEIAQSYLTGGVAGAAKFLARAGPAIGRAVPTFTAAGMTVMRAGQKIVGSVGLAVKPVFDSIALLRMSVRNAASLTTTSIEKMSIPVLDAGGGFTVQTLSVMRTEKKTGLALTKALSTRGVLIVLKVGSLPFQTAKAFLNLSDKAALCGYRHAEDLQNLLLTGPPLHLPPTLGH